MWNFFLHFGHWQGGNSILLWHCDSRSHNLCDTIVDLGFKSIPHANVFFLHFHREIKPVFLVLSGSTERKHWGKWVNISRSKKFYFLAPHLGQTIEEWTKWIFLKDVFHKFYLVHSWILCSICCHVSSMIKLQTCN